MKFIANLSLLPILLAASFSISVHAADLPGWDQLTIDDRNALMLPIRDRWEKADPAQRQKMLDRAKKLAEMTPEQRAKIHKGARRFMRADPQHREQLKAMHEYIKTLPPEERRALRQTWQKLTPAQRRAWIDQGGPEKSPTPPMVSEQQ